MAAIVLYHLHLRYSILRTVLSLHLWCPVLHCIVLQPLQFYNDTTHSGLLLHLSKQGACDLGTQMAHTFLTAL
jgi:hypothetical protein